MKTFVWKRLVCLNNSMQFLARDFSSRCLNFIVILFNSILQDKLKDFLEKKENGELLIQKASNLLQNILKQVRT